MCKRVRWRMNWHSLSGNPVRSTASQYDIRWVPDAPKCISKPRSPNSGDWYEAVRAPQEEPVEVVEPAQPIHANLIEFPGRLWPPARRVRAALKALLPRNTSTTCS